MTTLQYSETLTVVHCTCGIAYAIPQELDRQLLDKRAGKNTWCPLGHQWHYTGKTDAEKLADEHRRHQATRDLLHQEERSHQATRGHLTRARKRAAAGLCPCCHRSFQNVQRHMKSKHPDFNPEAKPDADTDH